MFWLQPRYDFTLQKRSMELIHRIILRNVPNYLSEGIVHKKTPNVLELTDIYLYVFFTDYFSVHGTVTAQQIFKSGP